GPAAHYTLAAPATTNGLAFGNLTNILLLPPTQFVLGSSRRYTVLALYDNGTTSDATATATLTSSNANFVSVPTPGRLYALGLTNVLGLRAVYSAKTNIQLVTVSPLSM